MVKIKKQHSLHTLSGMELPGDFTSLRDDVRCEVHTAWTQVLPALELEPQESVLMGPAGCWPMMTSQNPGVVYGYTTLTQRVLVL